MCNYSINQIEINYISTRVCLICIPVVGTHNMYLVQVALTLHGFTLQEVYEISLDTIYLEK